ncbi:CDP-diacylglycerol--glycerol-3-phosphate 3-phosphatidyltransferase [Litorimonas sp. RW-G-Af-16]|uniref:CDP-diacylglycerol--glycerol-3-phosphate 3-phosphatidyltransferase n=1 Tax=Litorimonas sp. RW-G-Af-16 TaxID=3241168 RepID=UPI00390C602C
MTQTLTADRHSLHWLPNALTVARILSIPLIVYGILAFSFGWEGPLARLWLIGGVFIAAVFTDFLDGYLARRWNVTSSFGRMIDPIADKLLVAGCLIAFMIASQGSWLFLIPGLAIIGRDILVSGAREHAALSARAMPPTKLAKWKTACEMLAIAALLVWAFGSSYLAIDTSIPSIGANAKLIGLVLLWLAAALSVYTGQLYVRAAVKD